MIEHASKFGGIAGYDVFCDYCPHNESFDVETFPEVVVEMKSAGWGIRKDDGSWSHMCPKCKRGRA